MKKIVITIVDGFHYRYLVDTGIIDELIKNKVNIYILTIESLTEMLQQKYKSSNFINVNLLESFEPNIYTKLYMKSIQLKNSKLTETLNIKSDNAKHSNKFLNNIIKYFPTHFLEKSFESKYYEKVLREIEPDLVILSTPGQKILDFKLAYMANKLNFKILSPVYSWDNLTAKGPFYFDIDYLIVWNDIMKNEAMYYHEYLDENCFVEGVPVFDIYASMQDIDLNEKKSFFQNLGLNPSRKLICVTTIPEIYFGTCHNELIKRLLNYSKINDFKFQILVRPHPLDETDYSIWNNHSHVVVDYYGTKPDKSLEFWKPKEDNTKHLGLTMKYSDIVINIASTITIDAACFDTPIINVSYDMKKDETEYMGSIERYYNYTHYKHVVSTKAAKMVYSDDDLFAAINQYLDEKEFDKENREVLIKKQAYKLDGQSGLRIARRIIELIK